MNKICFKCKKLKVIYDFYSHPSMPDGYVNKCKECNKKDVRENRILKIEYYRSYDRERGSRQSKEYLSKYREKYPKKYKSHNMVNNAIRDGRLKKEDSCQNCRSKLYIHAHHDDYNFPLSIRWLCAICHNEWHEKNGEAKNAI